MTEFCTCHMTEGKSDNFQVSIVVIGAGIAGLACASRLKELGFENVLVLEARDRIGGRIHTISFGSDSIEMGAQWIHGKKDNHIYEIANSMGLLNEDTVNYLDSLKSFSNYNQHDRDILKLLFDFLEDKLEHFTHISFPNSVQNFLDEQFKIYISAFNQPEFLCRLREGYKWFCNFLCEYNGCPTLSLLSMKLYDKYKECDGNLTIEIKNGFSSVLKYFLDIIPSAWIRKNEVVTKIDWTIFKEEFANTTIKYESGNSNMKKIKVISTNAQYLADHVIITTPLGYLKENHHSLFVPALSKSKERAICCLGFGVLNKIFLEFEEPFWEASAIYNVLWSKFLNEKFFNESTKESKPPLHWVQYIDRFAYSPNHRNMLCAWIAGQGAAIVESLSEATIISDCMRLLELLLQTHLPTPIRIYRSSWKLDPFSHGSYSFLSVDCDKENVTGLDLAEPEYAVGPYKKHPVLLFAGEATHDKYFSTVHGAYETGIREADRIFNHYKVTNLSNLSTTWESISRGMGNVLSAKDTLRNNLRIVIIGAGLSGLASALHLTNNCFSEVYIFEAQGNVGGRISSIHYEEGFLDIGAQWIHGSNNALFEFSKKHNLLPDILEEETSCEGEGIFCTSEGMVIDSSIVEEVKDILNAAKTKLENGSYDTNITKSVHTFFSEAFNSHTLQIDDTYKVSLMKDLFEWYSKFEGIDNACDDLNTIAVQSYTEWEDCPQELYHINFKKGFTSVVDAILSLIPNNNIYLNKPVKTVKWQKGIETDRCLSPVILEFEDGEKLSADSVIVTASAGFLKERINTFFSPSLPEDKLDAFDKIGFGTIDKIFLVYEKPFWTATDHGFHLVWKHEENRNCERLLMEHPWILGITGFDIVQKFPNVLLGWIGGKEAQLMEDVTETTVGVICSELLRIFLKRPDIPNPTKIIRSCWFNNPYVRGSYSNRTPKYYSSSSTLKNLQYPLWSTYFIKGKEIKLPSILFAGEAFDDSSFSSAHGAFRSGMQAAEYLIRSCSEMEVKEERCSL